MKILQNIQKIYMIGIGGASMSALALTLQKFGYTVAGSDKAEGEYTTLLRQNHIEVYPSTNYQKIAESDCVVYTAAIDCRHEEYAYAASNAILLLSRAQLLQLVLSQFKNSIAVAGCHGKSSTSAMLMHMLYACTQDATMHIGAKDRVYNNFYYGGNGYFVTEACEYKQSFLHLHPDVAIILNTEVDHMECYASTKSLQNSYIQFAKQAKYTIANYDDVLTEKIAANCTFGLNEHADIYAKHIYSRGGKYSFTLCIHGKDVRRVHLQVYGKFAIQHALACLAVADLYHLNMQTAIAAIEKFTGITRRMEVLSRDNNIQIIADYAHHPTALQAAIETVKKMTTGKLYIVFQPHTYSRTIYFFDDFIQVLAKEENVILFKTFAAREHYKKRGSAKYLAKVLQTQNKFVQYFEKGKDFINYIATTLQKGDTLLCLGAGNLYTIVKNNIKTMQILPINQK